MSFHRRPRTLADHRAAEAARVDADDGAPAFRGARRRASLADAFDDVARARSRAGPCYRAAQHRG